MLRTTMQTWIPGSLVAISLVVALSPQPAECKGKRHSKAPRYGKFLVPPPPAYMPDILPELNTRNLPVKASKPETPYSKYVQCYNGTEQPTVVQRPTNNYWSTKPSKSSL